MLINSVGRILSKFLLISNHHDVYFKCLTILLVDFTSLKLKRDSLSKHVQSYSITEKKGVKEFLDFELKR